MYIPYIEETQTILFFSSALVLPVILNFPTLAWTPNTRAVPFYAFFYPLLCFVPLDHRASATRFITIIVLSLSFSLSAIAHTVAYKRREL